MNFTCEHCNKTPYATPVEGEWRLLPDGWWVKDGFSDERLYACSRDCVIALNDKLFSRKP